MEDETQEIKNEDGTCGMKDCTMTATDMVNAIVPEPFAVVGDVTMDIKVHVCEGCKSKIVGSMPGMVLSMSNFDRQRTADDTSSVKEKSDADASEEIAVGEQGKCELVGYGDFTPNMLDEIMVRADDLARQSSSKLWRHAFMNLATSADYLQELYKRQLIQVVECATVGCDRVAAGRTKIDKAEVQGEDERMSSLDLDPIPLCQKCATKAHITEWVEV